MKGGKYCHVIGISLVGVWIRLTLFEDCFHDIQRYINWCVIPHTNVQIKSQPSAHALVYVHSYPFPGIHVFHFYASPAYASHLRKNVYIMIFMISESSSIYHLYIQQYEFKLVKFLSVCSYVYVDLINPASNKSFKKRKLHTSNKSFKKRKLHTSNTSFKKRKQDASDKSFKERKQNTSKKSFKERKQNASRKGSKMYIRKQELCPWLRLCVCLQQNITSWKKENVRGIVLHMEL